MIRIAFFVLTSACFLFSTAGQAQNRPTPLRTYAGPCVSSVAYARPGPAWSAGRFSGRETPPPPLANPSAQGPTASRGLAAPTAAPPSDSPAVSLPALSVTPRGRPVVTESNSYYDSYTVAPDRNSNPLGDRASITFWNLSSRDMTLKAGGRTRRLNKGQRIVLDMPRQFIWQVEARDPQQERVPLGESALEIVIRR